MHIAVDLDNTVLDATSAHLQYYNKESGLSFKTEDVNDFYIYRLYGWDKVEREDIYHRCGHDIHWNSTPYPMAVDILQQLFNQHQISIVTARPLLFREVTVKWLEHHKINYHNITLVENKLEECIRAKVNVLIDDGPHYAEEFSLANIPVILYDQPYNLTVSHHLVYRASNWMEIQKHIEHLETKLRE